MSARSCITCHSELVPARGWSASGGKNLLFYFCFLLLFCSSCSIPSTPSTPPEGLSIPIPSRWSQDLNAQATPWLAAQLRVYELPAQTKVHDTTMQVDETTGTVKAKSFKLPGGKTYKFIIEFQYLTPGNAIAFAYAEVEKEIGDGNAETVSFTSSDIRYEVDKQDPNISASISQGILPDLDPDNDGWSSYQELKDKVSPTDPSSIPQPPTLTITTDQPKQGPDLFITLEGEDNAHIEDMKLTDPICGVTKVSETTGSSNGKQTKQIIYRLDLLSVNKDLTSRELHATIEDGVTVVQGQSGTGDFKLDSQQSHPTFAFSDPEEGTELEGTQTLKGIACARHGINGLSLKHNTAELSDYTKKTFGNISKEIEVIFDAVNTTQLPDGLVDLEVQVTDEQKNIGSGQGKYKVSNNSNIKVDLPTGRRWVFGREVVSFSVVNLPNTTSVLATAPAGINLELGPGSSTNATYILDVSDMPEDTIIPIEVTVSRLDGVPVPPRVVEFKVRNKPNIKVFKSGDLWKGWKTFLQYEVENVDPDDLKIDGTKLGGASCSKDPAMKSQITTCKGSFAITPQETKTYTLQVKRKATTKETCKEQGPPLQLQCDNEQALPLEVTTLNSDVPKYGAISDFKNETRPASALILPGSDSKKYRASAILLDAQNQPTSTTVDLDTWDGGDTIEMNGLQPRKDYLLRVEELSGTQVLNTLEKNVTTGDTGLVLWLRLHEKNNGLCGDIDPNKTICDYSGYSNHGIPKGGPAWVDSGLQFDGVDDWIEIADADILKNLSALTIVSSFNASPSAGPSPYMGILMKLNPFQPHYGYELSIYEGTLRMEICSSWCGGALSQQNVPLGSTQKVVGIFDDDAINLYFDNNLDLGSMIFPGPIVLGLNDSSLHIGHIFYGFFQGTIDEVYLYNRALAQDEISKF
ncbi:MAG: LamG domain-containing protein [Deltaproteobacteria bacterium]|nr:LamG domain-containing protein [Deltaproteobacteria bacterium]